MARLKLKNIINFNSCPMGSFAKKKWPFLRQIRQKAWVMLEFISIFLYFFEKIFWTNSRDFFFLGHVAKFSFPDLGHVATIHGSTPGVSNSFFFSWALRTGYYVQQCIFLFNFFFEINVVTIEMITKIVKKSSLGVL